MAARAVCGTGVGVADLDEAALFRSVVRAVQTKRYSKLLSMQYRVCLRSVTRAAVMRAGSQPAADPLRPTPPQPGPVIAEPSATPLFEGRR